MVHPLLRRLEVLYARVFLSAVGLTLRQQLDCLIPRVREVGLGLCSPNANGVFIIEASCLLFRGDTAQVLAHLALDYHDLPFSPVLRHSPISAPPTTAQLQKGRLLLPVYHLCPIVFHVLQLFEALLTEKF